MTCAVRILLLTGILFLVGTSVWWFDGMFLALMFTIATGIGMWCGGQTFRGDLSWEKYAVQPLHYRKEWLYCVPVLVLYTLTLQAKTGWSFGVALLLTVLLLLVSLLFFFGGYFAYWLARQIHIGLRRCVVLELFMDCRSKSLPPEYWAALQPYIHSSPLEFYRAWPITSLPLVGDEIVLSGLEVEDWKVESINHTIQVRTGNVGVTTYIRLKAVSKEVELNIHDLLVLAEMGFQLHSKCEGVDLFTDIFQRSGLAATNKEYRDN